MYYKLLNDLEKKVGEVARNYGIEKYQVMLGNYKWADFTTNILGKVEKEKRDEIFEEIKKITEDIYEVSLAGIFINFRLKAKILFGFFKDILSGNFEKTLKIKYEDVILEFASVNPTGPVSIAHGRQAAIGDSLARVLKFFGVNIFTEHYSNDAGNQINLLAKSLDIRIRQLKGENIELPEDAYHGEYLVDLAKKLLEEDDREYSLDELKEIAVNYCRNWIINTFKNFRVEFDNVFSEKKLHEEGKLNEVLEEYKKKNLIYEKEGAIYLKTTIEGDDKDRVLVRSDGTPTYLLADIAYHINKFKRGFKYLIDILGQDHHEYSMRLKRALKLLGYDIDRINIVLHQMVNLKGERMSKRKGKYILLDDLMEEVGVDAIRYFFLEKKNDSHINFDVELAKEQSNKNPVYYIQYSYARNCGIFRKLEKKVDFDNIEEFELLKFEREIIFKGLLFEKILNDCINDLSVHHLAKYLYDMSDYYHKFYSKNKVIEEDNVNVKVLAILTFIANIVKEGLNLLGIEAKEKM